MCSKTHNTKILVFLEYKCQNFTGVSFLLSAVFSSKKKKKEMLCVLNLKCCASNLVVLNGLIYVKYLEEKSAFAIKVCIS